MRAERRKFANRAFESGRRPKVPVDASVAPRAQGAGSQELEMHIQDEVAKMLPESLISVANKAELTSSFQAGWKYVMARDHQVKLFEVEDFNAWTTFAAVFVCLIMLDNFYLNRSAEELTIGRALRYTLFWISTAFAFCGWIWYTYGRSSAFMWMSGYMLEWLLSFDNLFVFHLIFNLYGTPDHLKHRPLYIGICGAVAFRLMFIFVGEYMMHAMVFMHFVFGAFLVYTGVKTLAADEEDEDPSQNPMVKWLQEKVPFVNVYDDNGAFFVKVPVDANGCPAPDDKNQWVAPKDAECAKISEGNSEAVYGTVDFSNYRATVAENPTRLLRGREPTPQLPWAMAGPPVYRPGGTACAALVGAQNPFEPAARVPAAFEPVSRVPAVLPSKIVRTISPAQQWQPAAFACPGCGNVPLSDSIFCRRCGYRLKEDRPESPKAKTEDVVKLQSLVDSLQQANVELKLQAEMTPSLASQVEDLTKDLAACRQGKKRADEDLAKALRRVAELEAVVARQEADNSEGVLEKELLEDDRAKILEEANGRLFEMSRREQSLRGQCQLLKACCFRLWWCLRTDLPGLEVVSPPAPQEGTQAWCGQGVDPLPVNRMPLPDDWRGILQFQAQLFHGFAEALSHRTEVATGSSPKARAASPVHSREVAMSPKSPKEEGPAESAARHQHNGSAGHQHTEVLADFRAHPVNRPVEARKADQARRRSPAPKAGPAGAKPALRRPSSRAKLRASSADSQTGHRGGSSGKVSETSHGRRAASPQPERWKH
ncbi:putative membrane protein [Symbiodinium microadriaticum]|uniref:Putative membrane protein n=1 Tax=Symbiodinium microadriaticum TaxID=2951 RepID=A0A1Q9EJL1_SYMMI|nr:putative membrane protein [Symbiodinium microadriaticum]